MTVPASRASEPGSLPRAGFAFLGVFFLAKLAIAALGVGRGFELGDEGFFLLNLNHPEASPRFFEFYKLLLLFPEPPRFDVTDARWIRLATELAGSAVLVAGAFQWARARLGWRERVTGLSFASFALMGALLSAGSRSFSYNDATNLCAYTAAGALLFGASRPHGARATTLAAAAAAGFAIGFQLFVKFPSALVLLVGAGLAWWPAWPGASRRAVGVALGGGLAAAVALFLVANGGVAPLVAKFRGAAEVGALAGYDPLAMLARTAWLEVWTVANGGVLAGATAAGFVALRFGAKASPDRALAGALVVGGLTLAASVHVLRAAFASASLTAFACWMVFLPLLLGSGLWRERRGEVGVLALLCLLPVAAFAGTNVPWVWRLPSHALPLFVALSVLVHEGRLGSGRVWSARVVAGVLLVSTVAVFARHHVIEPYGLRAPLWAQDTAVRGLPGVRVDLASQRFLETTADALASAGFERGDPIVAMDYMPGLVFYLGGRSPGFPFYVFEGTEMNCFNLNRAELERPPFVITGRAVSDAQRACIEPFDLPGDFREIRTLRFPYEAVYAGFGGVGLSHVTLYAPGAEGGSEKPSASARE